MTFKQGELTVVCLWAGATPSAAMSACAGQESPPAFRGQSLRGFRFAARTEKSRAVMDGDDAMHPPLILFDYRTREFEPTRRSFDFIEVIALSVHRNDADVPSLVTNL